MNTRLVALGLLGLAGVFGTLTYVEIDEALATYDRAEMERAETATMKAESEKMAATPVRALNPKVETIEEVIARLIDDTEMLGSSVRFEVGDRGLMWEPVAHGVQKATVSFASAAERSGALGYFTLLWQIVADRPVSIRSARLMLSDLSTMTIEVDLFAWEGESS